MEVQKVNLSTVLDDEITSGADRGNNIITGEADVAEVVNGSGNGARNCHTFKMFQIL